MSIRPVLGSRASIGGVLGSGRGGAGNGLLTGLVAYWGLDEASGDALDKHSGGLTLTQANSPGADAGKVYSTARALAYTSNQYFTRSSSSSLQSGSGSFAFATWMYPISYGLAHFTVTKRTTTYSTIEYLIGHSTNWLFILGNGTTPQSVSIAGTAYSQWTLLMCWYDSIAATINIAINDGTPVSAAFSGSPSQGSGPFNVGGYGNVPLYTGRIGPVAFWKNRTLDNAARDALWNGGAGLAYSAFTA